MQNKEYKTVFFNWRIEDNPIQHTLNAGGIELTYYEVEPISKIINEYAADGWSPVNISDGYILLERVCQPTKDTIS